MIVTLARVSLGLALSAVLPGIPASGQIFGDGSCQAYPSGFVPFTSVAYISKADAAGDMLMVGSVSPANYSMIKNLPLPDGFNQQYCNPVSLAPGYSAVAYIPTAAERNGDFHDFAGLLIDPLNNQPFPGGIIPAVRLGSIFAWRVASANTVSISTIASLTIAAGNNQSASVNQTFTVPPTVRVSDANGNPLSGISVTWTVSQGSSQLSSSSTTTNAGGQAQITCTAGSISGPVTVTATAGAFSVQFSLTVTAPVNSAAPVVTSVVNGASYLPGPIAPGELIVIVGSNFAAAPQTSTPSPPLPTTLSGVSVTIDGNPLGLVSVNGTRITAVAPAQLSEEAHQLIVRAGSTLSSPFQVTGARSAPGIFTSDQTGQGEAYAIRPDGTTVSASNPARGGEMLTVFFTGGGQTLADQGIGPESALSLLTQALLASLNGSGVAVSYAGSAPTPGYDEAILQIPSNIGSGAIPISLAIASENFVYSQPGVTVAIQATPAPDVCAIQIPSPPASIGAGGGSGDFTMTTGPSCQWVATTDQPWITLTPASGTGPARISYQIAANSNPAPRTGHGQVATPGGQGSTQFAITQDGMPATVLPLIQLSGQQLSFSAVAGAGAPAPQSVAVASSGNNFDFSLSASDSWIRVTPGNSTTPDSATITVDSQQLSAGTYQGSVSVRASGASNSPQRINVTATISAPASAGSLRLDTDAANFTWYVGGVVPSAITVGLSSTGPPINYRVVPMILSPPGVAWVTARPTTGTTPGQVDVSVDVTNLNPGNYDAQLIFTPTDPTISPISLPVHIQVNSPIPARLQPAVSQLTFAFAQNGSADQQLLTVTNPSDSLIRFDVSASTSDGSNWLQAPSGRQSADRSHPSSVLVEADPTNLPPGSYTGIITITPETGDQVQVPVSAVVAQAGNSIEVSASSLLFQMEAGSPAGSADQPLNILRVGTGAMPWSAVATTLGGGSWLALRNPSGVTNNEPAGTVLNVGIQSLNLPVGLYEGSIQINAPSTQNGPKFVKVQLDVRQKGDIGPVLDTAGLVFTGVAGGPDPAPQQVNITNLGSTAITYNSSFTPADINSGLSVNINPQSARLGPPSITPGAAAFNQKVTISVKTAGLPPGIFRGPVLFTFPDGVNRVVNILLVLAPSGSSGSGAKGEKSAAACPAQFLTPLVTSVEDRLNVTAGGAVVTQLAVVDDCGQLASQGAVASLFSNGDHSINLRPLGPGQWGTTWQTQNESQASVDMNLIAQSQALQGNTLLRTSLTSIGDDPVAFRDGISLANNSGNPITPGALIQINGTRLADRSETAPDPTNLQTTLGGVTVLIGGEQCGLQSVASNQIVAVVPPDVAVNTTLHLVVIRGDRMSLPVSVLVTQPPGPASSSRAARHR